MAQKEVIDALPYIDLGYDEPGVRENVRILSFKPKICLNFLKFI